MALTASRQIFSSVGFGIERLGLVSLYFPKTILLLVALTYVFFSYCAAHLQFDSDASIVFRSKSADYQTLQDVIKLYPPLLNQVLIVVEGEALKTPEGLESLRSLHLDLELTEKIERVASPFSARHPPKSGEELGAQFVPDPLSDVDDFDAVLKGLHNHPIVKDKLVSSDGQTALLIATLEPEKNVIKLATTLEQIKAEAIRTIEGSNLSFGMTGLPVMRSEIISSLRRDQIVYISAGITIGLLFAFLFFGDVKYVLLTNLPGMFSITALFGGMWLFGKKVDVLTGMVTPLISVIALANALHLAFAIRRALADGREIDDAIATALYETGPGCVLSCLTTALALLALALAPFPFIFNFGTIAIYGVLLALTATLLIVPAAAKLLLSNQKSIDRARNGNNWFFATIIALCKGAAALVKRTHYMIAAVSVLAIIGLGYVYLKNQPRHSTSENLPASSQAVHAIKRIDEKLAGSNRLRLLIKFPASDVFPTPMALNVIEDADKLLESVSWLGSVWSLQDVAAWAGSGGLNQDDQLKVIERARDNLVGDVFTTSPNTALVTGYFSDINGAELRPLLQSLEKKVDDLRQRYPDIDIKLTGVSPLEAKTSHGMIKTLNISLLSAIGLIVILIGIALRSLRAGIISIVPNLLPIAAGGTFLYLSGYELQFTCVVAFTIGFGIAVDSTIHYLNHYRQLRRAGKSMADSVHQAILNVGPVLVISTLIIASGLGAATLSDLPMVQLYGLVSMIVLLVALVGDLLSLPSIVKLSSLDKSPSD